MHMVLEALDQFYERDVLSPLRTNYGSKLAKVIETIQAIKRKEGPATKSIVFIQWDTIAAHLEKGLKFVGISPLVLKGNVMQRHNHRTVP